MKFLGKAFGSVMATGAFLFAGVLLVKCIVEAVHGIWEPGETDYEAEMNENE